MADFSNCIECVDHYNQLRRVVRVSRNIIAGLDNANIYYRSLSPHDIEVELNCGESEEPKNGSVRGRCQINRTTRQVHSWSC